MTLTLEAGPWTFDTNNSYTSTDTLSMSRNGMMVFKAIMTNLGWSVVASSNGTTVKNIGDASPDLWLAVSNINFATSGAHSWIIFYSSTCSLWFYINCNYDTSGRPNLGVYYTSPGTNGTTSALPSTGSSFAISAGTNSFFIPSGSWYNTCTVMHGMQSADGKSTRIFNYFNYQGQIGTSMMVFDKLTGVPSDYSGDTYLFTASAALGLPSYSLYPGSQPPLVSDLSSNNYCIVLYNTPSQAYTNCYCSIEMSYVSGYRSIPNHTTSLPFYGGLPVSKIGTINPQIGPFGRLRDMWWGNVNHATLMTFPNDGTHQFIRFGAVLVPWNGSVPLGF